MPGKWRACVNGETCPEDRVEKRRPGRRRTLDLLRRRQDDVDGREAVGCQLPRLPLAGPPVFRKVCDYEQVHVASGVRGPLRVRPEENDPLREERAHESLDGARDERGQLRPGGRILS